MARGLHVVMLAAEAAPLVKAGGLADVVGALPPELEALGFRVSVIIPHYRRIQTSGSEIEAVDTKSLPFEVGRVRLQRGGDVYLVGGDRFFDREGIYVDPATGQDYPDQAGRWIYFQRSALDFMDRCLPEADVIHCHDHQTALIPAYLRRGYHQNFAAARTVLTIHNLGYQGVFPAATMAAAGFDPGELFPLSPFEFFGQMNFMKTGLVLADAVTTVSEGYAREIQAGPEYGFGLEGVLAARSDPPIGILNGIDVTVWNPESDPYVPATYSRDDRRGKQTNKKAILQEFGLDPTDNAPLLAMISRIDSQKGFDLVLEVLGALLERDVRFVLLGQGNKAIEARLAAIASRYPGRAGLRFGYDNARAHRIEAGADIFLMPSRYEPCGLNQMYSMRYGTVPVVRATGGLADTVQEFDPSSGKGQGFRFEPYSARAFMDAVERALRCWENAGLWQRIVENGMALDFSWSRSAERYAQLYYKLKGRKNT
jgi:starch synthase